MNISMSTFRLQLIDRNSKFPTVLKQKDNQIRYPENTFPQKRFYPESYEYLIVFYEFPITPSSIFEPASHRISHPIFTRVPSSLIYLSNYTELLEERISQNYCDVVSYALGCFLTSIVDISDDIIFVRHLDISLRHI